MSGRKNRRGRGSGNPQSPESLAGRGRDNVGLSVAAASTPGLTTPSPNIQTIGVRRPDYGRAGIAIPVTTNHFLVRLPSGTIHHYDGQSWILSDHDPTMDNLHFWHSLLSMMLSSR